MRWNSRSSGVVGVVIAGVGIVDRRPSASILVGIIGIIGIIGVSVVVIIFGHNRRIIIRIIYVIGVIGFIRCRRWYRRCRRVVVVRGRADK